MVNGSPKREGLESSFKSEASTHPPAPGSDDSGFGDVRDPFSHLLKFPQEMEPVYEALTDEQQERRQLDAVRIQKNIIYIDRINNALDVDVKERIASDQLIDKLATSRLDNMQRKLVAQVRLSPSKRSAWQTHTCAKYHYILHIDAVLREKWLTLDSAQLPTTVLKGTHGRA